jgi:archaellum biogenesis ATPase FlaH
MKMDKQDLFKNSPVRFFDTITEGGLKAGEMGLITSKKGLGKTSVLVQFGIDSLLQDKQLVHVSFDQHSSNVISWYESIFSEIAKKKNLGDVSTLKDEIVRNRTILNFNQESFTLPKVVNTLKALKEGGIKVQALIIDGLNLDKVSESDIDAVAKFVKAEKITAWFSDTKETAKLNENIRAELQPYFTAVCHLAPSQNNIILNILELHGNKDISGTISLDSKTLLMSNK